MNLIAAVDERWGLGRQVSWLARVPQDLRRFKALTLGGTVVLGRKTRKPFPMPRLCRAGTTSFFPQIRILAATMQPLPVLCQPCCICWKNGRRSLCGPLAGPLFTASCCPTAAWPTLRTFLRICRPIASCLRWTASPSWRLLEKQQPFVHEDLHCCFALYENLGAAAYCLACGAALPKGGFRHVKAAVCCLF